jgi:nucleolar protein 56
LRIDIKPIFHQFILVMEIAECFLGVFAFDEEGKEVVRKLFPKEAREDRLRLLRKGQPTEEHFQLIQELTARGFRSFIVESEDLARALRERTGADFKVEFPSRGGRLLRAGLSALCPKEELWELARSVAAKGVREEASRKEELIILGVRFLENLDKYLNALYSVLMEWYELHFPELPRLDLEPRENLAVLSLGRREELTLEKLGGAGISEPAARKVMSMAAESLGAELPPATLELLRRNAEGLLHLWKLRDEVEAHLDELMAEVAPNLRALAGGILGARLLSKAGGLKELARMTAGHLQILGAEKSYFRSLRGGGKRPKHGLIYLHPKLRSAPRKLRGKIARALAGKLVLAARVDATSGRFMWEEFRRKLEERLERIHG